MGKHKRNFNFRDFRDYFSESIAYEQQLSLVAERKMTATLARIHDWKAFCSYFSSVYEWELIDEQHWAEMAN